MYRFDCQKCENFTLCLSCYKDNTTHAHRFKKQKVPLGQGPPQNSSDLLAKAYMQCCTCKKSLLELSKRIYVCETCSLNIAEGDAKYWCKKCQETTEHEHKRTKLKAGTGEKSSAQPEEEAQRYLDNLFEDYHNLECEDVIGGGAIKARFGYQKVEKADFGLTDEDIFLMDDRALNQLVSIKNYRPFKHIETDGSAKEPEQAMYADKKHRNNKEKPVNIHRVINLKKQYRQQVQDGIEMVTKLSQIELEAEKAKLLKREKKKDKKTDRILMKRKHKQSKKGHDEGAAEDDEAQRKKKRMSLYGV